jgi:hypothetical protein
VTPSPAAHGWIRFFVLGGAAGGEHAYQWRREGSDE